VLVEFRRGTPPAYLERASGHEPRAPPVVELGHLFLIVLMTQDLKISGHPLMRTAEFTPSPRNDVVNLNTICGATPHAPPSVEPQHEAAQ
jgi:hypothetical protein